MLQRQRPSGPWLALPGTVCLARPSHWPPSSREEVLPPSSRQNQVSSKPFAPRAGRVKKIRSRSKGQIDSHPWHCGGTEARGNLNDHLTEQRLRVRSGSSEKA